MTAHFTVQADPTRDLIAISMSGFFSPADIQAFFESRAAEHAKLRCARNQHLTINDLSEMKVQAQQVVGNFQLLLADPTYTSRRLAFVVNKTLMRSQLMRALNGRDAKCFESRAAAEKWLFAVDVTEKAA